MKTSELTGALLDYWVAKAEGIDARIERMGPRKRCFVSLPKRSEFLFDVSANWAQGGPIIEREKIEIEFHCEAKIWEATCWGTEDTNDGGGWDKSALIAAMRAYVASKYGNIVGSDT